ncbi:hypothetical protein [Nostoc sp. MS1]|uniref:hypothetical protein n=1 Tax=Nostoc sp. MS1 TaxID=2764711 RepID=UPI001CC4AEDC|nr:hypothetical protein [Nostoc sp. MS1]BCL40066.1 hypothetical protein NSMS1_65130 [Nostoc sp. MS1]
MSQIEIAQIIEQIKQEIEVDASGKAKASLRATARLAGVSATAILKTLDSVNQEPSKLAQMLLESGFEAVNLLGWKTEGIPDMAIAIILEYYGFDAGRYCTKQARLVCRSFNTIGIRAWIQEKLGWTKPATDETSMTQIQLLAAIASQMAEQEQRLLEHEQRQHEILSRLKGVEVEQDRFNTPCGHKYSIVGFANLQGLEISVKEAGAKGRKASALCRKKGIEIERIRDPRFGRVGLYPESILIEVFSQEQN